ncbi:MAG: hypothetical protein ACJATU_000359 [Rickettsiales bacterium]|jgi:hypothetical protein
MSLIKLKLGSKTKAPEEKVIERGLKPHKTRLN